MLSSERCVRLVQPVYFTPNDFRGSVCSCRVVDVAHLIRGKRGELNCNGGQAWSSMKATMGQLMRDGQLNVLVQWGATADPDISAVAGRDVPLITDYARSDKDRSPLRLLASTSVLSRPLVTPPGVPAERIKSCVTPST